MPTTYANQQPTGFRNYVTNIAIVGAGGRSGKAVVEALKKGGKHKITAITRSDSTNAMPTGIGVRKVNYDDHSGLVEAFKGQEVLIITLGVMAPPESQTRLIDAAVEAGITWIIPNEWGVDHPNKQVGIDTMLGPRITKIREYIKEVGADKTHFIGICCSFWYEFSLAGTDARYGFDFDNKTLTLYDDGKTKINTTTWPQLGRAVANLLSLKVYAKDENDKSAHLTQYQDGSVFISSFFVNQRDMLDSVLRVTGDSESDWKISHEDVKERYARGAKMFQEGSFLGFGILLYARLFYNDGAGDFNEKLQNDVLGLPKEDLDEATKVAIRMAKDGETNAIPGK